MLDHGQVRVVVSNLIFGQVGGRLAEGEHFRLLNPINRLSIDFAQLMGFGDDNQIRASNELDDADNAMDLSTGRLKIIRLAVIDCKQRK